MKDRIDDLLDEGTSTKDIQEAVEQEILSHKLDGRVPSLRSVQRYIADRAEHDRSSWSLAADKTGNPRAVLEALVAAIGATDGRITSVSVAEAEKIAKIAAVADGMPALNVWKFARLYVYREWRGEDTQEIDTYLAFRPWEPEGEARYEAAARMGHIGPAPWFVQGPAHWVRAVLEDRERFEAEEQGAGSSIPLTEERPVSNPVSSGD